MVSQNNKQNSNKKNGQKSDSQSRKEEIINRVVRIIFIFAIVWIIGTMFSSYTDSNVQSTQQMESPDTNQFVDTDIDKIASDTSDYIETDGADIQTNEEIQLPASDDIDTNEQIEEFYGKDYSFRNDNLLDKHFDKHGIEMGFSSAEEYEAAASAVVNNPKALHKLEEEDGDDVYYVEDTNEFVVVSTDGYIRTYYYADKDYFNRQ